MIQEIILVVLDNVAAGELKKRRVFIDTIIVFDSKFESVESVGPLLSSNEFLKVIPGLAEDIRNRASLLFPFPCMQRPLRSFVIE
jgi:hypothetical protein